MAPYDNVNNIPSPNRCMYNSLINAYESIKNHIFLTNKMIKEKKGTIHSLEKNLLLLQNLESEYKLKIEELKGENHE